MLRRSVLLLPALLGLAPGPAPAQTPPTVRDAFLRVIDRPRVPLEPEVTTAPPEGRADRFARERFSFSSAERERVSGITVKPANTTGRRPTVIVLHGTGDRKEGMTPLLEALAARGFLAVAIDGRHHGERATGPNAYVQAILRAYRRGEEFPFLYDTVWDLLRLIDYLDSRPDVDRARIGVMGISKGGMETYLAAAVDPRIAAAVPVIGVQSFGWALEHDAWQPRVSTILGAVLGASRDSLRPVDALFVREFYDQVVPGIYSEFDGPAMLPLIAPRPLLVISGDRDELTPLPGVEASAAAAEAAYTAARAPERFRLHLQPNTGHTFTPEAQRAALDWLVSWLMP